MDQAFCPVSWQTSSARNGGFRNTQLFVLACRKAGSFRCYPSASAVCIAVSLPGRSRTGSTMARRHSVPCCSVPFGTDHDYFADTLHPVQTGNEDTDSEGMPLNVNRFRLALYAARTLTPETGLGQESASAQPTAQGEWAHCAARKAGKPGSSCPRMNQVCRGHCGFPVYLSRLQRVTIAKNKRLILLELIF